MDYRTKHHAKMHEAVIELRFFYKEFEEDFTLFFGELRTYSAEQLTEL